MIKISRSMKYPLTIILIISMLPLFPLDLSARKRRYKKETVRKQALELIQKNSEQVSELAGVQPMLDDSTSFFSEDPTIGEVGEDIEELEMEDDVSVDIEEFKTLWLSFVADDEEEDMTANGIRKQDIMDVIMDWLGTRYRFGGTTKRGVDCSAFVRNIFRQTASVMIPRTARVQYKVGDKVKRRNLEFGDLVFFHTRRRVYVSHVGIYLGDNLFAHASSRYGVTVSSLESTYYNKRFIGARRLSVSDLRRFSISEEQELSSQ